MVKEFLSDRGINFQVRNVMTDPAAEREFVAMGGSLPPVVRYKDRWVAGYDPEQLDDLLTDLME